MPPSCGGLFWSVPCHLRAGLSPGCRPGGSSECPAGVSSRLGFLAGPWRVPDCPCPGSDHGELRGRVSCRGPGLCRPQPPAADPSCSPLANERTPRPSRCPGPPEGPPTDPRGSPGRSPRPPRLLAFPSAARSSTSAPRCAHRCTRPAPCGSGKAELCPLTRASVSAARRVPARSALLVSDRGSALSG